MSARPASRGSALLVLSPATPGSIEPVKSFPPEKAPGASAAVETSVVPVDPPSAEGALVTVPTTMES